jgi:hypothetical protein
MQRCRIAPFHYILSSHGQERGGGLLQTSDGSILGRDDDESKAASGGRCRNGKDEAGMVWVCSGVVFSACGRRSRGCQCLERRAEFVGGRQKTTTRGVRFCRPSHSYSDKTGYLRGDGKATARKGKSQRPYRQLESQPACIEPARQPDSQTTRTCQPAQTTHNSEPKST